MMPRHALKALAACALVLGLASGGPAAAADPKTPAATGCKTSTRQPADVDSKAVTSKDNGGDADTGAKKGTTAKSSQRQPADVDSSAVTSTNNGGRAKTDGPEHCG